ncbi:MAG: alcohol dehydrogenase [Phenylobacterium sp.]|nr:alcohol dehydrogenase [Phenylobacterium sp.]
MGKYPLAVGLAVAAAVALGGAAKTAGPDRGGINSDAADWAGFGRTPGSQHYSPLDAINPANVDRLGLAWSYDLDAGNSVSAPVEAGGVLYTATGYSIVTALDAVTGAQLWRYDPKAAEASGEKLRQGWGIRGLAYEKGRVFVGTHDGRLIALDARTGRPLWTAVTFGKDEQRFITGPPRVFNGKVLIGHGGGDVGATRGYVTCYDAATGRRLWRFFTVPGDPSAPFEDDAQKMAAKSWSGDSWKFGGGGVVWHAMTYDPEFDRFYIGTGNAQPWSRETRSKGEGDNLFSASIVALDARTGKYVWHYQVNPGEEWDYDASMDMQLATLTIGGKPRKVLMQAPKNGFFYVLDRANGKLISAERFAKVTWASKIDLASGRPVEVDAARYHGKAAFEMWPGPTGAHNWLPMAFSPKTGLVYIPTSDRPVIFGDTASNYDPDLPGANKSFLQAWDPVRGKAVWRVETPGMWGGGAIATGGGLVFQGQIDHRFNAYDATSGKRLWSFDARAPVVAPPITFEVKGVQYVTVLTGYGVSAGVFGRSVQAFNLDYRTMPRRVLTFAVGGKAALPPAPKAPVMTAPADPDYAADQGRWTKGLIGYSINCANCHGFDAIAAGAAPDLRGSPIPHAKDAFQSIVRGGVLIARGMPGFPDVPPDQVEDIRFYLRARAQELPKSTEAATR